jgi:putative tricarboxylic transport membrane protein
MADIFSGLFFVVLSGAIYATALQLPAGRGNAPGPGFFPELMAIAGVVVGLAICGRALVTLRAQRRNAAPADAGRSRVPSASAQPETAGDWLRLALLLGVSVAYVVALRPAGFMAASALFLALSLLILGERRILILLLVPAGLTAGVLFIFTSLLGLRLPAGTLF